MNFLAVPIDRNTYEKEKFDPAIIDAMRVGLKNNGRVFILAGRKGTASGIMCWDCSFVFTCKFCEAPLAFYEAQKSPVRSAEPGTNALICRHCSKKYLPPSTCSRCGGAEFKYFGYGILEIQKALQKYFPDTPLYVISGDRIKNRRELSEIFTAFKQNGGILLGTELACKHDLPDMRLAIIFLVEQLLVFPEFTVRERAFALLNFLAEKSERLFVQTFANDNEFLRLAEKEDMFYKHEIENRKLFFLPPFSVLAKIKIRDKNPVRAAAKISALRNKIEKKITTKNLRVELLGPVHAFIPKVRNFWIFELVLKIDPGIPLEERRAVFALASPEFIIDVEPKSLI